MGICSSSYHFQYNSQRHPQKQPLIHLQEDYKIKQGYNAEWYFYVAIYIAEKINFIATIIKRTQETCWAAS